MSRIFKFENIYFGKNSVVKLFANKTHLETHADYDGTALAFLLDTSDFTNQDALLSHFAKAINSCNIIINAPMNAIICNTDAKVLTATAA